jgi:hypothetical protein
MKYIVYCTRNNKNSKIYIGVHGTENPFKFDGYLGCGVYVGKPHKQDTAFQKAVKKYSPKNFTRTVLAVFDTEDEAYLLEEILVDANFLKRRDTYNMVKGGKNNSSELCKKPVAQYDTSGKLLQVFESITDAAKEVNGTPQEISGAVLGKYKTSLGYIWRRAAGVVPENIVPNLPRIKGVTQYSKAGYKMRSWSSIKEAAKHFNCDKSTISAICKGYIGRKTIGGFQWRYTTDNLESIPSV